MDWKALEDLQRQNWRQLSNRDFLSRLKLKENLDAACLARVKRTHSEKQLTPAETDTAVETTREDFAIKLVVISSTCWKSSSRRLAPMLVSSEAWLALIQ